ncbi:hypothetical protein [Pseudogemmobacter bohemicus]|uniref:hypothetical protein n=1 Tax=Pseudogemmobacter bohemicus TaxID=2250708 RepID=UPI000DD404F3|nr:hypothetical protein [Pseudogemmobacter bohemicus]
MKRLSFEAFSDLMVLYLCQQMRASDAAEIFAMRPDMDAWSLYRDLAASQPAHLWFEVARPAGGLVPLAFFGVMATSPGVGIAHLVGTKHLGLAEAREIAARIRLLVIPAMIAEGLHRVEALSLSRYRWAHRFLQSAGARPEGPPRRALGRAGEDFQCFVWLKDELQPPETSPKGE